MKPEREIKQRRVHKVRGKEGRLQHCLQDQDEENGAECNRPGSMPKQITECDPRSPKYAELADGMQHQRPQA
jgi:hypothetical protein